MASDKQALANYIRNSFPISTDTLNATLEQFEEVALVKGEFLLRAERVSDDYFFLESGFMRAFTIDTEGNEVTTNFYAPGRIIFEASSFFTRTRSTESIQALIDCRGYTLHFEQLKGLFHAIPEFREFGRAMLVKELVALKQRSLAMYNQTAEERYAHLMASNSEVFQHAQLKQIASYLGITDTSLSRIRKDIAKK